MECHSTTKRVFHLWFILTHSDFKWSNVYLWIMLYLRILKTYPFMSIKDPLCHDHKRWLKNANYLYLILIFF